MMVIGFHIARLRKSILLLITAGVLLALMGSCYILRYSHFESVSLLDSVLIGGKYYFTVSDSNSVLHEPGYLWVYYLDKNNSSKELWPRVFDVGQYTGSLYLSGETVNDEEEMIVFPGGLSDDPIWKEEPALLVHDYKTGVVCEISHAITKMALEGSLKLSHQEKWPIVEDGHMEGNSTYFYDDFVDRLQNTIQLISIGRMTSSQTCYVYLTRDDIIRAIENTKRDGEEHTYLGFKYIIDPDPVVKARLDATEEAK